ncbi:MAG: endonuclease/exonuclease/phosphatase family protein [Acidobacteriota bacterium]
MLLDPAALYWILITREAFMCLFRRLVILLTLVPLFSAFAAGGDEVKLRIMAANTSSGRLQSYPNPGPGTRIFQALSPDVVLIQEFNVNATRNGANGEAAVDAWVDSVFGGDFHWFREPGGDAIPNGVISRWPIIESGQWPDAAVGNRDFAFARIDVPGDVDLWVVSVHFLTRDRARPGEAASLVSAIRAHPVPEADFLVIAGDFNADRRNEPALTNLRQVVDTAAPFPDDGGDPPLEGTNARRRKPYDWVLADADLQVFAAATEVGGLSFPNGLVFDTRIFTQEELDESFPPTLRADSGARQMQHMAVVRDFLIGGDDDGEEGEDDDEGQSDEEGEDDGDSQIEPLDVGGFRLEQTRSAARVTLPPGTLVAPRGFVVIGRGVDRAEFEAFWGQLAPNVIYLNGSELAGEPGFPLINGDESYRLIDAEGTAVDPPGGTLPTGATPRGNAYERQATDDATFTALADPIRDATPGRYPGRVAGSGRLLITEFSDAPGGGSFIFEFIELFYDAVAEEAPQ